MTINSNLSPVKRNLMQDLDQFQEDLFSQKKGSPEKVQEKVKLFFESEVVDKLASLQKEFSANLFEAQAPKNNLKRDRDTAIGLQQKVQKINPADSPLKLQKIEKSEVPHVVSTHSLGKMSFLQIAKKIKEQVDACSPQTENYSSFVCPAKPQKKSHKIAGKFEKIFNSVNSGSAMVNGLTCSSRLFAAGSFMKTYTLDCDIQIQPDVKNCDLLLKIYSGVKFLFNDEKMLKTLENSKKNYNKAKKFDLPVSIIYNIETAVTDGFFLAEFIPEAIDLTREDQLAQVRTFFEKSFQNKVPFDLSYSNLRVKNDVVTLIDFVEKPFEFSNTEKLRSFAIQFLKGWSKQVLEITKASSFSGDERKELALQLLTSLTQGLEKDGFDNEWNKKAVDEYYWA